MKKRARFEKEKLTMEMNFNSGAVQLESVNKSSMLRIRKPRNFSFIQLTVVCAIGFLGGVYIYKPLLVNYFGDKGKPEEPEAGKT